MIAAGQENFDDLLTRLDSDREEAGQKYEKLRRTLITYFRYNTQGDAAALADETLDRVAKRLVEARDLLPFVRGVARLVALEVQRKQKHLSLENVPEPASEEINTAERERDFQKRTECLANCLHNLRAADYKLVVEYYRYQGAQKAENKRKLAMALQTTMDALTVRVFRLRSQLRACVTKCMAAHNDVKTREILP